MTQRDDFETLTGGIFSLVLRRARRQHNTRHSNKSRISSEPTVTKIISITGVKRKFDEKKVDITRTDFLMNILDLITNELERNLIILSIKLN